MAGAALGAAGPGRAVAGHWPGEDPNRPPGHSGEGSELFDEGDVPTPSSLPARPEPTVATVHDRGDAVITRFGWNLEASNFGCSGDERSGLVYVSQRLTDRIVAFDRAQERFVAIHYVPTDGSGAHAIKVDPVNESVWYAAGEASKIGRLVLDPLTRRPVNFVEYTVPGDVRVERKPHGLVAVGDSLWYTDDRQDRVGFVHVASGRVTVIDEHIEADGIALEDGPRGRRVWVAGGATVTVIDAATADVLHRVPVPQEPGFGQLRLHDLRYEAARDRVWVLSRGSDHVLWMEAGDPEAGPQAFVTPSATAAGLDHCDLGERYLWCTEGRANNVSRLDLATNDVVGYEVPAAAGYFNPHGIFVSTAWREVWFTEREALCRLTFKDGGLP